MHAPRAQERGYSLAMGIGQFVVLRWDFGQDLLGHLQEVPSTPGMLGQDGGAPGHHSKQDGHGCSPAWGHNRGTSEAGTGTRTPQPQSSLTSSFRLCSRQHKTLQKKGFLSPLCPMRVAKLTSEQLGHPCTCPRPGLEPPGVAEGVRSWNGMSFELPSTPNHCGIP